MVAPDPIDEFRAVLVANGLQPGEVVPDGKLRRCSTIGKPGSSNGWYLMFEDGHGGVFGDWSTDLSETWSGISGVLPDKDRCRLRSEIKHQKAERERAKAEARTMAVEKARRYLAGLPPATAENPYLQRKDVPADPRLLVDGDLLVVPVMGSDGKPMSYQRIDPSGSKRFASGAPVAAGFFAIKGNSGALVIAEGIATGLSLNQATGLTILVAFSSGNLKAVARLARVRYPDRKIILAADNDMKTQAKSGQNPGVEAANAAACTMGGLLAVPERPGDFNDLHQTEGLEMVKATIEAARLVEPTAKTERTETVDEWPELQPLIPMEEPEPYPSEALPGVIGKAVAEVTAFVQCPLALTACSALAAISTVAGGHVDVRRTEGLVGPATLYLMAVAESGERKSTVDSFFKETIRQWEKEQEQLAEPDQRSFRANTKAWEGKRDGILNAIRDASKKGNETRDLEEKLRDLENRKPNKPKEPRLLVSNVTCEQLAYLLCYEWPVAGMISSEAGIVFGGHAMGRESIMRNLGQINELWDGTPFRVDRRASDSFQVRGARLSLGLAVQPETVKQFIDGTKGLARGSGFLARFLIAMPESTQGRRMFQEAPKAWPALNQFRQRLSELLGHPMQWDDSGQLAPAVLSLAPEAKAVWVAFHNEVEAEVAPNGEMTEARDVASKAADNAARMAALFHCFERGPVDAIGVDHMQRAACIVTWHLYEARRFLSQIAIPKTVSDALLLESWLVDQCRRKAVLAVPRNQIQKFGPNRTRRKAALDAALTELEGAGRIRRVKERHKAFIILHPKIREGNHGSA